MTRDKLLDFTNEEYNDNHRKYGSKLYAMDVDMIEFNKDGIPQIIKETKHGHQYKISLDDIKLKCQANLAKASNIPHLLVFYYFPGLNKFNNVTDQFGPNRFFYVFPLNNQARNHLNNGEFMSELNYVKFLYRIKNETLSNDLNIDELHTEINNNIDEPLILNKSALKGY